MELRTDLTSIQELTGTATTGQRCAAVVYEKLLKGVGGRQVRLLERLLKSLDQSLCCSVRLGMVWGSVQVLNAPLLTPGLELG